MNLPRGLKGTEPGYQVVPLDEIPVERREGTSIRRVAGPGSPVVLRTKIECLDVQLSGRFE